MKAEKQLLLDQIIEKTSASKVLMLLSYKNLDANVTANFRNGLLKAGGELTVTGKRVFRKAAEEAGIKLTDVEMPGHVAFVTSQADPIETTKAIFTFTKENKDTLEVLGGQFEGQNCTAKDFEEVANLPTQDAMRAQMLGLFGAPMSQLVSVMQSLLTSPIYLLDNKVKKEEGEN